MKPGEQQGWSGAKFLWELASVPTRLPSLWEMDCQREEHARPRRASSRETLSVELAPKEGTSSPNHSIQGSVQCTPQLSWVSSQGMIQVPSHWQVPGTLWPAREEGMSGLDG